VGVGVDEGVEVGVGGFGVWVGSFVGVAVNVETTCGMEVGVVGTGLLNSVEGIVVSLTLPVLQPADREIANPNPKNKIIERKVLKGRNMFGFISDIDLYILPPARSGDFGNISSRKAKGRRVDTLLTR